MSVNKIMIIGSSGSLATQIASTFALKKKYLIKKISRKNFNYIKDLKKLKKKIDIFGPNVIINCSSLTGMLICKDKLDSAFEVNSAFPAKLAELIKNSKVRLIHFSTESVFEGGKKNKLYSEKDIPNPLSVYGKTKLLGEIVNDINKNALVIRLPLLYGDTHYKKKQIIGRLLGNLKLNKKIYVSKDVFSTPVYSPHIAEFLHFIIQKRKKTFERKLLHLTSKNYLSIYELIKKIAKPINKEHLIVAVKDSYFGHDSSKPKNFGLKTIYSDCYLP